VSQLRTILVVGIGAGDPEFMTVQAINAINSVEVFFFIDKGSIKDDLLGLRQQICTRFIDGDNYRIVQAVDPERDRTATAYGEAVTDWHERRAELYEAMIATELDEDGTGAFLVWGDPSLYDGTLRIIDQLIERGRIAFEYKVIPGISSVQTLAARHRIPLNRTGESIRITTGRRLRAELDPALDTRIDNVIVMLDSQCAFTEIDDPEVDIYWGAYLGTGDEVLMAGPVVEVAAAIQAMRGELRARKGWIMDTYLLRRRPSP
jgi:precorrin-6A synthase